MKAYKTKGGEVQALRGLSMHVRHGQMVSVIGPSGSGKTTLLNLLGGLDTPTAGRIKIGDHELEHLRPEELGRFRRINIGYILQTTNLLSYLTAAENVELPLIAARKSQVERQARVEELLNTVNLSNRASHRPEELSGGERQRIAIAAALANDPAIILADEPTGELDTVNAHHIVRLLVAVREELGKTIVLVTHDPSVARESQLIFSIEDGVIKSILVPSQTFSEKSFYVEGMKARIAEIDRQLNDLDSSFGHSKAEPAKYAEERYRLQQVRNNLEEELQRQGYVG